jgi:hypothetical protein
VLRGFAKALESLRQRDPSSRLQLAARNQARSRLSDADACAVLTSEVSDISADEVAAEIERWHPREDFLNDRAFRLLVGIRDGGAVPAIDPALDQQFAYEEELGRLPLREAFARLAATRPGLGDLEKRASAGQLPRRDLLAALNALPEEDQRTVERIVVTYLMACARGRDDQTPMFDRPSHEIHGTVGFTPDAK